MNNAEEAIKNSEFLIEQVKRNKEEDKKQQDETKYDSHDYLNLKN